jgi:hypothetical protein
MPLGAFRLNTLAAAMAAGPTGTSWGAYTGSSDGATLVTTDSTYGIGCLEITSINPNTVIVAYNGTANVANNVRIGAFTWDGSYTITHTAITSLSRPYIRSAGNFITGSEYTPIGVAKLSPPNKNGYLIVGGSQEGGGGGFQYMDYKLFTTTVDSNTLPSALNSTTGLGMQDIGINPNQFVPVYGKEDATTGRLMFLGSGGGGSNSTNYVNWVTYSKTDGLLSSKTINGLSSGARLDDGARHPIALTTELDNLLKADALAISYSGTTNQFATQRYLNDPTSQSYADYYSSPTWTLPSGSTYNRSWYNKHQLTRPGQQLFLWGNVSGSERFFYGKGIKSGDIFYPSSSYVDYTFTDGTYTTFVDYQTVMTSATEGVVVVALRNSDSTSYALKIASLLITPQIGNTTTPSITSNGAPITVLTRSGVCNQVKIASIDSSKLLLAWAEDGTKLCSKIIVSPATPDPVYAVGESNNWPVEGDTVTFAVRTRNVANTTLYWTIAAGDGSFNTTDVTGGATSGSFSLTSGSGSFSVTLLADTSDPQENFIARIRTGSTSGPIVAQSNLLSIQEKITQAETISQSYSTASTCTLPTGTAVGDYVILFDRSTTTTDTIPSGWTSINKATTSGIRTNISYKVMTAADITAGSITGMAGIVRKIMTTYRPNGKFNTFTVSTPGSQATTAAPTSQTLGMNGAVSGSAVVGFACYAATGAISSRGFSLSGSTEYTSGTTNLYVTAISFTTTQSKFSSTITMTDSGTNTLQSFYLSWKY